MKEINDILGSYLMLSLKFNKLITFFNSYTKTLNFIYSKIEGVYSNANIHSSWYALTLHTQKWTKTLFILLFLKI